MSTRLAWAPLALAAVLLPVAMAFADEARTRTVSVSGQGEISAEPDLAHVTLGVEARRPTLAEARSEVTAAVERLLALTKSLGIDPRLVNATRVQVLPEYSWNDKDRKRILLGYFVSRQVQVELRNLEQLGTLLERAVDAGANQVSDPVLDSSRRKDLERDAMTRAVQDARQNAETLAKAAGAKLGNVRALNASAAGPVVPVYRAKMVMAEASMAPEATFQAGDMKFSAMVSAEYDLVVEP